ncbi:unnamed protein product, partial [Oppiella nova]
MGDDLGFRNYVYLLWVVSVTPVVYILKNDLTAQMVNRDVMNADTIDDMFDDRLTVYADVYSYDKLITPDFQRLFEASISQHWDNLLADYYYQVYRKIFDGS